MPVIFAHVDLHDAAYAWEFGPLVVIPLLVTAALYVIGLIRLWANAGVGRGITRWQALSFAAGWVVLVAALDSPIATVSEILFSMHMTQHTLLMLVAAPLLVFGQPLTVSQWAVKRRAGAGVVRSVLAWPARWPRLVTAPLTVFLIHLVALWLWHVPSLYEAALRHESIHALEHLCFVAAAALFWWGMTHGRYGRMGYGIAVFYVFLTAIHSAALGALLTTSSSVWYADYVEQATAAHIDALAGLGAWRAGVPGRELEEPTTDPVRRTMDLTRFMAYAGITLSVWFIIAIIALEIPPTILRPCQ